VCGLLMDSLTNLKRCTVLQESDIQRAVTKLIKISNFVKVSFVSAMVAGLTVDLQSTGNVTTTSVSRSVDRVYLSSRFRVVMMPGISTRLISGITMNHRLQNISTSNK